MMDGQFYNWQKCFATRGYGIMRCSGPVAEHRYCRFYLKRGKLSDADPRQCSHCRPEMVADGLPACDSYSAAIWLEGVERGGAV